MVTITTEAGQILSGFGLREEGELLVFNNTNGEQVRLPLHEVLERKKSTLSPMPPNIVEQISEQEFNELLAYLLTLRNR